MLPPLSEQKNIAAALDDLQQLTELLGKVYQQKLAALNELKLPLRHQAFTGAL